MYIKLNECCLGFVDATFLLQLSVGFWGAYMCKFAYSQKIAILLRIVGTADIIIMNLVAMVYQHYPGLAGVEANIN